MTKFVIFTRPRSGSHFLCSQLDSIQSIVCDAELFHPHHINYADWRRDSDLAGRDTDRLAVQVRDGDIRRFLATRFDNCIATQRPLAWGFKHIIEHGDGAIRAIEFDPDFKVICLIRRDPFAEYVSRAKAFATGQWFSTTNSCVVNEKIRFDLLNYVSFLNKRGKDLKRMRTATSNRSASSLWITYEELLNSDGLKRVLSFIGAPAGGGSSPDVGVVRQSSGNAFAYVDNPRTARFFCTVLRVSGVEAAAQTEIFRRVRNIVAHVTRRVRDRHRL